LLRIGGCVLGRIGRALHASDLLMDGVDDRSRPAHHGIHSGMRALSRALEPFPAHRPLRARCVLIGRGQSSGLAIGQAASQAQQNAALVEESAAAAESLRDQAQQLVQVVAVFKLEGATAVASVSKARLVESVQRSPAQSRKPISAARPVTVAPKPPLAARSVDVVASAESWESF
jgi:hypothetical protein